MLKTGLGNLYLHTRPFWRFLICGVAHALSMAHHVTLLGQVAIKHKTMYQATSKSHLFHSFGEELHFFRKPMILFAFVSFIFIFLFFWRYPALIMESMFHSSAVIVPKQDSFVAGNGQVEHASLGLGTWCHVWLAKFQTKFSVKVSSDIQRCVLATFEIWLFHVSFLP